MSNQKAAKNSAVLQLSCVQHAAAEPCHSMSFGAPWLRQEEQRETPWLSWKVNLYQHSSYEVNIWGENKLGEKIWGETTESCWS